jgi:hypothetical protein
MNTGIRINVEKGQPLYIKTLTHIGAGFGAVGVPAENSDFPYTK